MLVTEFEFKISGLKYFMGIEVAQYKEGNCHISKEVHLRPSE